MEVLRHTNKKTVILIKLGGSAITDKSVPYKARKEVIKRLAVELKKSGSGHSLIISHGSGSFAHTSAAKYGGKKGYKSKNGIARVSADAARLNQIVTDIFVEAGIPAVSISPMSMILASRGKLSKNFFEVIEELLKQGLIPVVYGDVIWDKNWKSTIFSGEKVLSEITVYLLNKGFIIERVIQVGETKGVYNLDGETIEMIDAKNIDMISRAFVKSDKIDVTGGIKHKVETAFSLTKKGINTLIINGLIPDQLSKAVKGQRIEGTTITL